MRATPRRNGSHMVTVRVTHHVYAETVALILATLMEREQSTSVSNAKAEEEIRFALALDGSERWDYATESLAVEPSIAADVRDEVARHLDRLGYPADEVAEAVALIPVRNAYVH